MQLPLSLQHPPPPQQQCHSLSSPPMLQQLVTSDISSSNEKIVLGKQQLLWRHLPQQQQSQQQQQGLRRLLLQQHHHHSLRQTGVWRERMQTKKTKTTVICGLSVGRRMRVDSDAEIASHSHAGKKNQGAKGSQQLCWDTTLFKRVFHYFFSKKYFSFSLRSTNTFFAIAYVDTQRSLPNSNLT
ncbi:Hypothetical protein, putative [Bodo saltans]|uniref:Uncharacterized protein n=1 Tax=Bodo saltans TaxID=75058 RepID=A0A0S4JF91_BODSA|nr:Hypothetical protein, putative [Bodo saltans]|eukprot:CUG87653.1 Hypothetical protein, putative [Bodo saltans]